MSVGVVHLRVRTTSANEAVRSGRRHRAASHGPAVDPGVAGREFALSLGQHVRGSVGGDVSLDQSVVGRAQWGRLPERLDPELDDRSTRVRSFDARGRTSSVDRPSAARVTLLDGFGLEVPGRERPPTADDLPRGVQRLVAHLCLSHRPTRTATAGQLWPDVPEDHAHGSLRSALWRLNKAAPGLIEVTGGALRLAVGELVRVAVVGGSSAISSPVGTTTGSSSNGSGCVSCACRRWRRWKQDSPSSAATVRPWRPPMQRSALIRCGRALTGRWSVSTWPRATWLKPSGPTTSSGRWWRTSWACPRPSR